MGRSQTASDFLTLTLLSDATATKPPHKATIYNVKIHSYIVIKLYPVPNLYIYLHSLQDTGELSSGGGGGVGGQVGGDDKHG